MTLKEFSDLMGYGLDVKNDMDILNFFEGWQFLKMKNASQPYEFKEEITQRGGGSGDETFYVFEEKETGKLINYYIYDSIIEVYEMESCHMVSKYNFQGQY